jgi:F-type H+-transporting ATPase subunit delta
MQGVSRGSLVGVREKLDSVIEAGTKKEAAAQRQVAEQLFAVLEVLDANAQLRRLLSDPAVDADRKARLAADIFGEQLSSPSSEILEAVVRAPWGRPSDLIAAIDELAAEALFATAEKVNVLDDVEDELFRFGRILDREPTLRSALTDPSLPDDRKTELIETLLGDRVQDATLVLVREVVLRPRGRTIDRALEEYGRLAAARRERLVAQVRTVVALTDEQMEKLGAALAARLGHQVHLNVELDPQLLGGLTVQVGDILFDASIAHRLAVARRVMTG